MLFFVVHKPEAIMAKAIAGRRNWANAFISWLSLASNAVTAFASESHPLSAGPVAAKAGTPWGGVLAIYSVP